MVLTFTCTILLTYLVVRATKKAWDYVLTTSIVHFVLCIIGKPLVKVVTCHMGGCHACGKQTWLVQYCPQAPFQP